MSTATFRVSTDILRRLGEELMTSFDQGIVELVKNSYDADALKCTVELLDTEKLGGTVVITDNGDGLSLDDILDGWLVLGRSRKNPRSRTRRNRLPAGNKGLGRIGALRMGDEVVLISRPRSDPGSEFSIRIRWSDFESSDVVEDVEFDIERSDTQAGPGTRVEIRRLRTGVSEREVLRLARELILLSDPFGDPSGFVSELIAPEFAKLEDLVRKAYFEDCELKLVACLDGRGRASAEVFDRMNRLRWSVNKDDLDDCYRAPSARFELWVFLLQGSSFVGRSGSVSEVRPWLQEVGGVHLYHRGLRVRPYGDEGHDWLDMNLSRARDPELRPSTNTSVGRVTVIDEGEDLLQKTDRSGFIENEAFRELRRFAIEVLEWMQDRRIAERDERRAREKRETGKRTTLAGTKFRQAIAGLSAADRSAVQSAALEFESAGAAERVQLREELGLYQTLASVGTAVSVFAHEIEGPATNMVASINAVERRARRYWGASYETGIGNQVSSVKRSAQLLKRFATLPLALLKKSKRRRTELDVNRTVGEVVTLFAPYLQDARVETIPAYCDDAIRVRGSVAAVEAIMSNLITNAVKAFKRQDALLIDRKLIVRTSATSDHVVIAVLDNGPGVQARLLDRIWLPGVTSDENGTGLGLTIVRDTVSELGGKVTVVPKGELGGAEFIVELPRVAALK